MLAEQFNHKSRIPVDEIHEEWVNDEGHIVVIFRDGSILLSLGDSEERYANLQALAGSVDVTQFEEVEDEE